jgi:uncharacterized membrane protein YdjX (TVP38/TMEM64 family)
LHRWRARLLRLSVPVALGLLLVLFLQHTSRIAGWLQWMDEQGPAGDALFVAFFVGCTLLMVPASILEAGAGFLYGPIWGIPVASAVGTAAATISFVLGRTLLRGVIERRIARDPRFGAIDRAVGARGLELVFLLRLSPLAPFNVMSYALGLTRVRVRDFALGTALGHLFPVIVFVYTGSTVASAMDLVDRPSTPPWATAIGLLLTVVATIGVSRFAKRALDQALSAHPPTETEPEAPET